MTVSAATQRLARLVTVLLWIAIVVVVALLARAAVVGALPGQTRVDPRTGTPGLAVETDAGTGCQYIVTPWGGIMPRTGADGKQLCPPK